MVQKDLLILKNFFFSIYYKLYENVINNQCITLVKLYQMLSECTDTKQRDKLVKRSTSSKTSLSTIFFMNMLGKQQNVLSRNTVG